MSANRTRGADSHGDTGGGENARHYRELFETSRDGIAHLDMEGRFIDCNPAFLALLGYPSIDALRGMTLEGLSPPESLARHGEVVRQTHERGYSDLVENEYLGRDGQRIPTRIRAWLRRDAQGGPSGTWVVLQDLRERREAEEAVTRLTEQLFHSQKMEAIGRLAGGIAHDFNNLLTTIIGYAHLMREAGDAEPVIADGVREIEKAANRAAGLVRQLLAFSRRQELSPQLVHLNELVVNLKKMLERLIGEDVALLVDLDLDAGRIKADPGQVEQVIINLAVNARDAMPEGGRLLIETRSVELDSSISLQHAEVQPGQYILLQVSDTGSGMDENVKAHLFEPFFTTKEKGKGTGLGLSTVYGIVRQSGGHIWVYSEVSKGTVFKVYFPRHESASEPARPAALAPSPQGGTDTILLVEDEPQLLTITALMLSGLGYRVIEKQNAQAALELLEDADGGPIDLMVTDVVMPGMGGRELAEDRASKIRPGIKVLFVSGYTGDAVLHHGVRSSGISFLQKPFSLVELDRKIREALSGRAGA